MPSNAAHRAMSLDLNPSMSERPQRNDSHSISDESIPRASHETGGSSATGSLRDSTPASAQIKSSNINGEQHEPRSLARITAKRRDGQLSRRIKQRPATGFLLEGASAGRRDRGHSKIPRRASTQELNTPPQTPDSSREKSPGSKRNSKVSSESSNRDYSSRLRISNDPGSEDANGHAANASSVQPSRLSPSMDMDSAQIVNMALNLSESRRFAAGRRNVSNPPAPPRLSVQGESSTAGNLKQHFQQQRKISLAGSPKLSSGFSPRLPSTSLANSPFQTNFESNHDGLYGYQFSASTLARAERAKQQLELKAEYLRLLAALPPLKAGNGTRMSHSPPSSPTGHLRSTWKFGQPRSEPVLGRQYNPLQYIRNRKIRARERKVIDGEQQGFNDIEGVRAWVNKTTQRNQFSATLQDEHGSTIPPYPAAEAAYQSGLPLSRTSTRSRRPRVDWFIEPCDMIADAYWIDQDNHKNLIEDRNWEKLFPPSTNLSRPMTQQTTDADHGSSRSISKTVQGGEADAAAAMNSRPSTSSSPLKTRDRTMQKLHQMKAFHHRHTGSLLGSHDFRSLGRDSESDSTDSEMDDQVESRRLSRRRRAGTISSDGTDLIQKQMLDMIAREAQEKELVALPETIKEHEPMSTDVDTNGQIHPSSSTRDFQRTDSVTDISDSDHKILTDRTQTSASAHRAGRASLEVPTSMSRRGSQTQDSSVPTSPEFRPRDSQSSRIGTELKTPRSRSTSPSRNPVTRARRKWRDRDRDGKKQKIQEDQGRGQTLDSPSEVHLGRTGHRYNSSDPWISTERPNESSSGHRSNQSLQMVGDSTVGLRGMFKPRIDGLRGGVNKFGDILWKKSATTDFSDHDPAEESESELRRGRSGDTYPLSRPRSNTDTASSTSKHFLNAMPEFLHAGDASKRTQTQDGLLKPRPALSSRPSSSQSARFQRLKPPRIDVRGPSPTGDIPTLPRLKLDPSAPSENPFYHTGHRQGDAEGEQSPGASPFSSSHRVDDRWQNRHLSAQDASNFSETSKFTKRDIARMRALILSSGIKAMEIHRRAQEQQKPFTEPFSAAKAKLHPALSLPWADLRRLSSSEQDLSNVQVLSCELYDLASSTLHDAIRTSGQKWQKSADHFTNHTAVDLQKRIWNTRNRVTQDLSGMAHVAADQATETARELNLGQPLKMKRVLDHIELLSRNRRRRFRWLRRGLWLMVEWTLVGFMWYVWFIVMILRIVWGTIKGIIACVRWLLWLQ